jgi:CRP-like cAMP-binding protein
MFMKGRPMPVPISNLFLSGLSPGSRDALLSRSVFVELPLHTVLYNSGPAPGHAFFLTSGLASVVTPMVNGEVAEVCFIGHEGIIGSLQLLGPASMATRCMMQLAGAGLRIPFPVLQRAFDSSEEIRRRILNLVQEQAVVVAQIAGCNRLHCAEERLVRWLLMAQDQTGFDLLRFTQQYLAEMIGAQRTTVTVLAGELQQRGLIRYSRGSIDVLDRAGLEEIACDCYPIIRSLHTKLYNREANPAATDGTHSFYRDASSSLTTSV